MLASEHGLLARLDALVEVVADRHGLALAPGGRLAAAEARLAARAAGIASPRSPTARGPVATQRDAVELLRAVAEGVGLLRVRATGWRRPACATPGPRSTPACAPGWSMPPGASK
jgi:hypothetical protein